MTGGNLASIGDADEATVITTMVALHYDAAYWIGLRNVRARSCLSCLLPMYRQIMDDLI